MKWFTSPLIHLIIISLALFGSASFSGPTEVEAQERPPVLAFYYAWFDQNTWTSGQSVDLPAEPYNSADRAAIERHVAQAQGAGIDAFVQSWYGPQEANNQTETNFRTLLDVAAASGFRAAVDVEVSGPFFGDAASVTNALATLLATHAQHPAYLRYQGKPVIFFWRQQRFGLEQWQAIRNQVDPDRATIWIAEGTDLAYQAVFDGHHLYSIAWSSAPANELAKWGDRVRAYEANNDVSRLWVATAMAGYDDTRLPRANAFAVPRRGGDYYRETWQGAVASGAEMILINSFNEWPEGTHIEPSASYGNFYLDVTRELVASLNGSPPPQAQAAALPPAQETPSIAEEGDASLPDGPYVRIGGLVNVRSGPSTDFEPVGQLQAGAVLTVTGQTAVGDWWQIEFAEEVEGRAWVADRVVQFVGDPATVPVVETPTDPADRPEEAVESPTFDSPPGGITVYGQPDPEAEPVGRVRAGETIPLVGRDETGDWWQVDFGGSQAERGWVAAALVDVEAATAVDVPTVTVAEEESSPTPTLTATMTPPPSPSPTPTATITPLPSPTPQVTAGQIQAEDAINVRAAPSLDSDLVGGLYLGDTAAVYAISEDGQWWQIEFVDGPDGLAWVAADFVRFQGDEADVPIFGLGTPTPTPGPTNTPRPTRARPSPTLMTAPPTFAPTPTSRYQSTAAALLERRGTPAPVTEATPPPPFEWRSLPWGLISILLIVAIVWFQWRRQG